MKNMKDMKDELFFTIREGRECGIPFMLFMVFMVKYTLGMLKLS